MRLANQRRDMQVGLQQVASGQPLRIPLQVGRQIRVVNFAAKALESSTSTSPFPAVIKCRRRR